MMFRISVVVLFFFLGILKYSIAQECYVAAPNTLRLNAEETIAVAMDGDNGALVTVYVQDHPGKTKNITETVLAVQAGQPSVFKIHLDPAAFPANFLTDPGYPKLVSLNAVFPNFRKELLIPVSSHSGYMFIQTDKPIYTPKQRATLRIIPLNEDALPTTELFQLQIRNPKNVIVLEQDFNKWKKLTKAFASYVYKFPTHSVLGEWSATVRYGHNLVQNSTVQFKLEEYVLPTFKVELKTPDLILPNDETIEIEVKANYVYGKKVQGILAFRLGVKGEHAREAVFFATITSKELDDGAYLLKIKTDDLKLHKDIGWFPEIEGSRLVVEATVVDSATGNKEIATDSKCLFSKSPFVISFKRCLQDFKPGLTSVFEPDITYVGGSPASGVPVKILAVSDKGAKLDIVQDTLLTKEDGKVSFEVKPEIHHKTITLTVETADPRYGENQAKSSFVQLAYESKEGAYIAIARSSPQRLRPGDLFAREVHFQPAGILNIYYMVVAKGKILAMNKLPSRAYLVQKVSFQITHDMVPDFRVLVFAHHNDALIADSLKIDVERICHPSSEVSVEAKFPEKRPGAAGKMLIRGSGGTTVGILGVDDAIYALSKKDLLTKKKVFDRLASHDLGCGPGGGVTINSVLGNAGITIGTTKFTPSESHSCVQIKRKKREAVLDIVNMYTGLEKQCCAMGTSFDKFDRSCQRRTDIVTKFLAGERPECSKAFLDCCVYAERNGLQQAMSTSGLQLGRSAAHHFVEPKFIELEFEDEVEKDLLVRSDFRETWFNDDFIIGPDERHEIDLSLPHSITTWVIQAVSVSPEHGICVAEPQTLVSFQRVFLHLNLPYSVVRNEQVEIQATVFNYGIEQTGAVVYMFGEKHLCSGSQAGEKSERKRLVIPAQSAASVIFPVIPLKIGEYPIKVEALTPAGSDVIERLLYVVPEGVTKEIDIPIKLDPTNQQRRSRREIQTELYTDNIDDSRKLQVTTIKLPLPEGFVPDTASCYISALGDRFGPVIETSINNPDGLLQKPRGCGEQNMMFLAPTLYTMRYLKVSGKLTAESEEKGYAFIRHGYGSQLAFRKNDGSYAAYQSTPTSTWLTAFVMKVFCQATDLIHIDEDVLCSGVRWLINNQEPDGSYMERHPVYHVDMMGGVQGKVPLTAFTLIALQECKCDEENLLRAKTRALAYLETHMGEAEKALPAAIVAYALSLSGSDLKDTANENLLAMATHDAGSNTLYWKTDNAAQDIEATSYALLNQLYFNDMGRGNAIVNWLNTKQLRSGCFKSTQDTVVALQAMSEYAIKAQMPTINLVANISTSYDRDYHKVFEFNKENALVLQDAKLDRLGGTVFINTAGHGMGLLSVKLRYNVLVPPEDICKFDVTVTVEESVVAKQERVAAPWEDLLNQRSNDEYMLPDDLIRGLKQELEEPPVEMDNNPRRRLPEKASLVAHPFLAVRPSMISRRIDTRGSTRLGKRVKRDNSEGDQDDLDNSKVRLKISICARYLGNADAGMSIVDAGLFSGFEPDAKELQKLQDDPTHLIQRFENSSRGIVFYLQKVPTDRDYCFSFHVTRQYIVGNTQMSVIKVYDYYNPDATCTKFYSPGSNSPILRTICDGGICQCAEGGCPPKRPFAAVLKLKTNQRRKKLETIFCENYNYVWKGKLDGRIKKEGGFLNISFLIEEVIKPGIEKAEDIEGEIRTLLARDNCGTANLFVGVNYLILGNDGQKYMNENGETWHRYLLDKTSIVKMLGETSDQNEKKLRRDFSYVRNKLKAEGCDL